MTEPLFIALEGIDGAGKSTQVALLSAWLDAVGVPHVSTREPGGTPVAEAIRKVVLGEPELTMPHESELLLILAARAAFVRDVVRPALEAGRTVVADRFSLSTLAYQGYGRGLPLPRVREIVDFATGGLAPDVSLVLDLPVDEGSARQARGGSEEDRIEAEGLAFRASVRKGYLALAASEPDVDVVDARGTPEEVHARLRGRLVARFPARLGVTAPTQEDGAG